MFSKISNKMSSKIFGSMATRGFSAFPGELPAVKQAVCERLRIAVLAFVSLYSALYIYLATMPAAAYSPTDGGICDWSKLGLNEGQSKQVQEVEADWEQKYRELTPALIEDQRQLSKLLEDHDSDPLEIMTLQGAIARKREQLNAIAVASYLKKKALLDDNQKHVLELMTKRAIAEHHRSDASASVNEEMPDHIQGLMQRVRNIWPVQGER